MAVWPWLGNVPRSLTDGRPSSYAAPLCKNLLSVNILSKLKPFWICFGDTEVGRIAYGKGSCAGDILTN